MNQGVGVLGVVSVTPRGEELAARLAAAWREKGRPVRLFSRGSGNTSLREVLGRAWQECDQLVLVMAVGIAVRCLAPLLGSKWCDPGVVVVDEGGSFAVSLLGGHWGLANDLAREVAAVLGSVPVVTTATDARGVPALDAWARRYGFLPVPREKVKEVSKALLEGARLVLRTEWVPEPPSQALPFPACGLEEGVVAGGEEVEVFLTSRLLPARARLLTLCPPSLVVGLGCRAGVGEAEVLEAFGAALAAAGRFRESVSALATHTCKRGEEGLRRAARVLGLPVLFFTSAELAEVFKKHSGLARSVFVQERLGVGGVCEAAALAAVTSGELVLPKQRYGRVTVAVAEAGLLSLASGLVLRRRSRPGP